MAGELVKTEAICLRIVPWSRTSHVVSWLTPQGKVTTLVKGAERAKSFFLGQYDLNYTCEIVYYARAKADLHALRECAIIDMREHLRGDYRRLVATEYMRHLTEELAPSGPDAEAWFRLLSGALDTAGGDNPAGELLEFEISVLNLAGVSPDFAGPEGEGGWFYVEEGSFRGRSNRKMPVSAAVAACLRHPGAEKNIAILLDAARVIGVYYTFHLDFSPETRRTVFKMLAKQQGET